MYDAQPLSYPIEPEGVESDAQMLLSRARETQRRSRSLAEEAKRLRSQRRSSAPAPLSRKELLAYSPYARLVAQLETLPVVEQAKGILMAQSGVGEAEAFALLRRASQRSNVPVRELAARIVATTVRKRRRS